MNKKLPNALILHQSNNPLPNEITRTLNNEGILGQSLQFKAWLNNASFNIRDVVIFVLDDCTCLAHEIFTVLDLGRPVIILDFLNRAQLKQDLSASFDIVSWPENGRHLAEKLRNICLHASPIPLHTPKLKGLEQINSLSIHGISTAFLDVIDNIQKFSRSQAPILISGETGTGKELAARALHYLGPRRDGPFIPINCSGLPDTLFENEIFGHEKGAFTDAKDKFTGLVEQASNGTLFLDEVDSLQPRAQASLLRFLQDKKFRPLGSTKILEGQCAIVAATNKNLENLVNGGYFRQDLFYRLNTITIDVPPLRNRLEDITLLARVYLRKLCNQYNQAPKSFHPETLKWLERQSWPGNVRQLENCIHRAFLLSDHPIIKIQADDHSHPDHDNLVHLPPTMNSYDFNELREQVVQDFERQYLHRVMQATAGNVTHAARLACKERRCLGKLLKKHGIDREKYCL